MVALALRRVNVSVVKCSCDTLLVEESREAFRVLLGQTVYNTCTIR